MASQQGWNQQTPAVQSMLRGAMGTVRRSTRTVAKKARSTVKRVKRAASKVKRTKARLVKGSKAAKAYMAKIRKLKK